MRTNHERHENILVDGQSGIVRELLEFRELVG